MGLGPIYRRLEGIVNGKNTLFETPTDYLPGSVIVYLNGLPLRGDSDDGWSERGNRKILMKVAPVEFDVLQAFYMPI